MSEAISLLDRICLFRIGFTARYSFTQMEINISSYIWQMVQIYDLQEECEFVKWPFKTDSRIK